MAVIIVPNTGSTLTAAACIIGSENKWTWWRMTTPITASGSATVYASSTSSAGTQIDVLVASPGVATPWTGPFSSSLGVYFGTVTGGCVVWMMKK